MDVDSGEDSEDDFNATLQTPRSQRNPMRKLTSMTSNSSMGSSSTKLSTANRGSTLWTDNSSDSDSASSDESSAAGQKRSSTVQGGRDSQGTASASSRQVARQASTPSTSESLDEETPFDNSSDTKRRRVTAVPVRKPAAPLPRVSVNDATVRGRGRGRGQIPTRTSSRIANSSTQAPGMAPTHSSSSQTTIGGSRGRGAPVTRDRTVRGRA